MNWRMLLIAFMTCCFFVIFAGEIWWKKQINDTFVQASVQLEERLYLYQDLQSQNEKNSHITRSNIENIEEQYTEQMIELLVAYQEQVGYLLEQAKREYMSEVLTGNMTYRDLVNEYVLRSATLADTVEVDFEAIYSLFADELIANGYQAEDGFLYYVLFEEVVAETQRIFALEITSLH